MKARCTQGVIRAASGAAAILSVTLGITGCGAASQNATVNNSAVYAAFASGTSGVEVSAAGRVTRTLGMRTGRSGIHEGFLMRADGKPALVVRVEDNVDLTGPIPLSEGERVVVHGQYEYYPRGGVIHWTHHDPAGRHPNGYIIVGGKTYQ